MPVVPSSGIAIYPTANDVLNLARSIVNDAALSLDGNVLSNSAPYTFTLLNSAYQDLQDELIDRGVETLVEELVLDDFPKVDATVQNDPSIQVYLAYTGSFDGVTLHTSPALPENLVLPLRFWERTANTNAQMQPMIRPNGGLPSYSAQSNYLRWWDYRSDAVYFIGSLMDEDLRLRYISYFVELVDGDSVVLLPRSKNALAYLTAAEFAAARGSALAQAYRTQAGEYIGQIATRTSRGKQRVHHRRRPYGRQNLGFGFGW